MSDPRGIRDGAVDRAWRDAMREEPSPQVDDAILAAAHRAAGARPRVEPPAEARGPWRWWMPLAAAATIGAVAVGVIQTVPRETVEPTVLSDAPPARRPSSSAAQSAPPPAAAPAVEAARPAAAPPAPPAGVAPPPASRPAPDAGSLKQRSKPAVAPAESPSAPVRNEFVPSPSERPAAATASTAGGDATRPAVAEQGAAREQAPRDQEQGVAARERKDASAAAAPAAGANATGGFVPAPPASAPMPAAAAPRPLPAPAASGRAAEALPSAAPPTAAEPGRGSPGKPEMPSASPKLTQPRAEGAAASAEVGAMAVTPPATFIAEIRRRLAAGDRDGAVRELQRFRRTHADADARLPEDLRAFAAAVPR